MGTSARGRPSTRISQASVSTRLPSDRSHYGLRNPEGTKMSAQKYSRKCVDLLAFESLNEPLLGTGITVVTCQTMFLTSDVDDGIGGKSRQRKRLFETSSIVQHRQLGACGWWHKVQKHQRIAYSAILVRVFVAVGDISVHRAVSPPRFQPMSSVRQKNTVEPTPAILQPVPRELRHPSALPAPRSAPSD